MGAGERFWRLVFEPSFRRRLLIVELIVGTLLLRRGIQLAKDSESYLEGAVYRSPLYPLLLDAVELLFGRGTLTALLVLQVAFGLTAVAALVLYLRRALALPEWLAWLAVVLLLVLPYLGPLAVSGQVMSEGIAYPLFLLVMRSLLGALLEGRLERFAGAAGWSAALILSRPQFIFLLAVLALSGLTWLVNRSSRRRAPIALFIVAALAAGVLLADRGYRLARHGRFAAAPFVGVQLVAGPLYVAPGSLADELPTGQRELFAELHDTARRRGLLAESNPSPGGVASYSWHFRQNYNELVWRLIVPVLQHRLGADDWFAIESQLLPLARSLILAEPLRFARLYLSNLLSGLSFPYAVLLIALTLLTLARGVARGGAELAAGLVTLTHLANCALIALVEPLDMRYSFYTDGLVLLLLVALVALTARPVGSDVRHSG